MNWPAALLLPDAIHAVEVQDRDHVHALIWNWIADNTPNQTPATAGLLTEMLVEDGTAWFGSKEFDLFSMDKEEGEKLRFYVEGEDYQWTLMVGKRAIGVRDYNHLVGLVCTELSRQGWWDGSSWETSVESHKLAAHLKTGNKALIGDVELRLLTLDTDNPGPEPEDEVDSPWGESQAAVKSRYEALTERLPLRSQLESLLMEISEVEESLRRTGYALTLTTERLKAEKHKLDALRTTVSELAGYLDHHSEGEDFYG